MTASETSPDLRFDPPGPGFWTLDAVHFPRPATRYWSETHPESMKRGTNDFARFYGLMFDGMQIGYVNGFAYNSMRPVPEEEISRRFQRAEEVFDKKLWREQLSEWDETVKPASIAKHREIQAVDPDVLSDQALADHLTRCRDHHAAMLAQHMRFTAGAMIPTGDFLIHVGGWTGLPPAELLGLLRGSASVSAGGSIELERLVAGIGDDDAALELLESGDDPDQVLAKLRALGGEQGEAVTGYLDFVGYRPLDGFDICEPYALELPDALLRAIRIAVSGKDEGTEAVEVQTAAVRNQVPEEHRSEFDDLLAEARLTYRLRDERGIYSDSWASGLMWRGALAAGRRLAAKGRINDPEHMVDASLDEMRALLSESGGPSADELSRRSEYRATHSAKEAPPSLGTPPPPPPDPSGLPPAMARLMGATGIAMGEVFGSSEAPHEEHLLRGLAASQGIYEGPARRVSGPSEFGRIIQGDVLVTEATSEAFNILLPLLGAIVTDNGGLLSHSAIVAREYGIPGVVGTRDATDLIADGTRIRVDGDAGEVTVLAWKDVVPLAKAHETSVFGSKAVGLGDAERNGLHVPPGVALSGPVVEAVASGDERATARVAKAIRDLGVPLAVRSSAVDEDGAEASFAGQHLTLLNVPTAADVPSALRDIWWSANSDSAITYRQRVGLFTRPSVGVVVQTLLDPDIAGVMFTENPVTGADERVIEASWGLGEAVVAGLVIPDHYRLDPSGQVLERKPGRKSIAVRTVATGGTVEEDIAPDRVEQLCLDDGQLEQLSQLAARCEQVYGPGRDIEWALAGGTLYLLQCRAVTTGRAPEPDGTANGKAGNPAETLRLVPIFAELDRKEAAAVARLLKERHFSAGETVVMEGSGGAAFFLIDSGEATVTIRGVEQTKLQRGDYFGEIALIDEGPRAATVTATSELVCFGLTFWEFRPLVQQNGAIGWKLLQSMAKKLRDAQQE